MEELLGEKQKNANWSNKRHLSWKVILPSSNSDGLFQLTSLAKASYIFTNAASDIALHLPNSVSHFERLS